MTEQANIIIVTEVVYVLRARQHEERRSNIGDKMQPWGRLRFDLQTHLRFYLDAVRNILHRDMWPW